MGVINLSTKTAIILVIVLLGLVYQRLGGIVLDTTITLHIPGWIIWIGSFIGFGALVLMLRSNDWLIRMLERPMHDLNTWLNDD